MSVYNGGEFLREAIDSILDQTYTQFEFIIVDDGSTDNSINVIESYKDPRIVLIRQVNKGLVVALNVGLRKAQGKYIARMDADDISIKNRLEIQLRFMESNPEYVAIGSNAIIMDIKGTNLYTSTKPITWEEIKQYLPKAPFFHSSTVFHKDLALNCGAYYEKIRHHFEDLILFNQLSKLGKLYNIRCPLIKYRLVPSAISNKSKKADLLIHRICGRVLKNDEISEEDITMLKNLTKKNSSQWKWSNYYLRIAKIYIEIEFHRGKATKNLLLAIINYPINKIAWFNLFLLLMPRTLINKWKDSRSQSYVL